MDATYVLSFIGMLFSIMASLTPRFYSITYTDDHGHTRHKDVGLFFTLFDDPDKVTNAAFVLLLVTAFLCSCGGALLNSSYRHGFGEHEENIARITCFLSIWFILIGTLGFASLVSEYASCLRSVIGIHVIVLILFPLSCFYSDCLVF